MFLVAVVNKAYLVQVSNLLNKSIVDPPQLSGSYLMTYSADFLLSIADRSLKVMLQYADT